jgi:hypothetical protein
MSRKPQFLPLIAAGVGSLKKKAGMVEDPQVRDHAGLLEDEPPSIAGLPFV